jgi:hypothetical protein
LFFKTANASNEITVVPGFSFGHCLLCKWIVPAKEELGKEHLRWDQFQTHKLHEQLPMPLAIAL